MTVQEIESLAATSGGENLKVEFKQSISWKNPDNQISITRSVLGMSNVEGGGRIIIGVAEQANGTMSPIGMTESDYNSFVKDHVKQIVANYADTHANIDVHHITDGVKRFVEIDVKEFDDSPVICKKDWDTTNKKKTLRAGRMYARSHGVPGASEVTTPEQLREILELATKKNVAKFIKSITQAGILPTAAQAESDDVEFDGEVAGL